MLKAAPWVLEPKGPTLGNRQWEHPTQQETCWVGEVADTSDAHADKDNHRSRAAKLVMLCQNEVKCSCLSHA